MRLRCASWSKRRRSMLPIPREEPAPKSAKVINLMDALRKSVRGDEAPVAKKKGVAGSTGTGSKKGLTLVKSSAAKTGNAEIGLDRYGHQEEVQTEGGDVRSRCGR